MNKGTFGCQSAKGMYLPYLMFDSLEQLTDSPHSKKSVQETKRSIQKQKETYFPIKHEIEIHLHYSHLGHVIIRSNSSSLGINSAQLTLIITS